MLLQGTHSPGIQKAPKTLAKLTIQLLHQASWAGFGGAGNQYAALAKTGRGRQVGCLLPPPQTCTGSPPSLQGTAMPGTVPFARAHKPGVEKGTQLGQRSRTMVQGQQDLARKYALGSRLEDGATFPQLQ